MGAAIGLREDFGGLDLRSLLSVAAFVCELAADFFPDFVNAKMPPRLYPAYRSARKLQPAFPIPQAVQRAMSTHFHAFAKHIAFFNRLASARVRSGLMLETSPGEA